MRTHILPSFNSTSSMHRVFGDFQPHTDIRIQDNVISAPLLQSGKVEVRTRLFFWKPTYAPLGTVTKRYECFYDGILVDYTCDKSLIVKTFRWLTEKGMINATA